MAVLALRISATLLDPRGSFDREPWKIRNLKGERVFCRGVWEVLRLRFELKLAWRCFGILPRSEGAQRNVP
jgi:hypothetical protein